MLTSRAAEHLGIWDDSVPNQSPKLVIVSIVFFIISSLVMLVRFAWRWAHQQRGWDDLMALCAYAILLIMTVFGFIAADYGFGKPSQYIMSTLPEALEYFYLYQICYKLLGGFTKLTFCFLYLRIFPQKSFNRLIIAVAVIIATGTFAFTIGTVFQCTPVERAWNHNIPGTCTSNTGFWYSHAAFNTFMDIVVYVLPIPLIRTLKLERGTKTGLISIFGLGAFVIAASIVRMVSLRSSALTTDPTWGSLDALMWTEIEGNTSVICCCMPALRVPVLNLWHKIFERTRAVTSRSRSIAPEQKDAAWDGPHRSTAQVGHGAANVKSSYTNNSSSSGSNSNSNSRKTGRAETWYERALKSLNRDETTMVMSRNSSQDELAKPEGVGHGVPEVMELGAIYKTTDLHVSTSDVKKEPKPERRMSLADFLKEG
ncbi:hypothetical protein AMS68_006785 [Peltaster fructicola]|uniref:Rhodopsin domain-containing protein n=1 Tax=Peltaster fructicola TaxID=286661 RepID=A0A6H0Y342_9PEZI|nr:hypothetical protein AMS68_006785 [Peltaster fructicola]